MASKRNRKYYYSTFTYSSIYNENDKCFESVRDALVWYSNSNKISLDDITKIGEISTGVIHIYQHNIIFNGDGSINTRNSTVATFGSIAYLLRKFNIVHICDLIDY